MSFSFKKFPGRTALSSIRLLLWKNFLIQLRHPILSIIELLLPCALVLLMCYFRRSVDVIHHPNATVYQPLGIQDAFYHDSYRYLVMFTPEHELNRQVINETLQNIKVDWWFMKFNSKGFNSSSSMLNYYLTEYDESRDGTALCGIEFREISKNKIDFTLRFTAVPRFYKKSLIRENWFTTNIMPDISSPGPREGRAGDGGKPGYAREGFNLIQHYLTMAAAMITSDNDQLLVRNTLKDEPQLLETIEIPDKPETPKRTFLFQLLRFPYPPYISDIYLFALSFYFPAVIMFSFIYPSVNITKSLVAEKEKRLKEFMKMSGLNEAYHWIAHLIKSILWSLPSLVIITVLLCVPLKDTIAIMNYSNPVVLFCFLFCYQLCNICLCFMISTFFSKANLSGIATGVIFFFTFIPFFTAVTQYSSMNQTLKLIYCIFVPNTNMAMGVYLITMKESRAVGMSWANLADAAIPNDNLSLALIMALFIGNACLYLLITWYVTLAFPGQYGVPLPWYFPLTRKYWTGNDDKVLKIGQNSDRYWITENDEENFEIDPVDLKVGIEIKGLTKSYDGGKTFSVTDLNLNTYHGQITTLLGHNGAGKTTTLSILTGLFKPSSGTAYVNGYNICSEMSTIRRSLGICPQFNILFDELTVKEHLEFYCKLKATQMTNSEIKEDVRSMIMKLDLKDKRNVQADKLSGGMKRKLCVGIALIGNSKVVILDEATSGMDVSARRFIWDLLLLEREHRSILLSTHFMEEADILGDRIAIMVDGRLQCCGSPLFLKKRFGDGYHLTITKQSTSNKIDVITQTIKTYIEGAKLESSVGIEVAYSLPNSDTHKFEPLLAQLENDQDLGVAHYGIAVTTMEEVFIKVGEYAKDKMHSLESTKENNNTVIPLQSTQISKNHGITLWFQQLFALSLKKAIFVIRSPFLTCAQLLVPCFIIVITIISVRSVPGQGNSPALDIELTQFNQPQVMYFYDKKSSEIAEKYKEAASHIIADQTKIKGISNTSSDVVMSSILATDTTAYSYHLMTGAVFLHSENSIQGNVTTLVALYNNQAYHSQAIALKYIDETLIRYLTNNSDIKIVVTNHPLPFTAADSLKISIADQQSQFEIMQGLILALAFLVGSFSILAVKERVSKGKHLQNISGVGPSSFWLSYFTTDFTIYLVSSLLVVLAFVIFKQDGLYEGKQPYYLILGFILHGLSVLPCIYVLSFLFNASATAYAKLCLFIAIIGIGTILAEQVTAIEELDLLDTNKVLKPIFGLFVPVYNLGKITSNLMTNYQNSKVCNIDIIQQFCKEEKPPAAVLACCPGKCNKSCIAFEPKIFNFNEPGIGGNLLYTIACGSIYFLILLLIELNLIAYLKQLFDKQLNKYYYERNIKSCSTDNNEREIDADVELEQMRIATINPENTGHLNPLVVKNLRKRYGKFVAVKEISYAVGQSESFGMLGQNGAGKTTTFKMITGDESITSGEIFIHGMNREKNSRRVQEEMGYCPQVDAVLEDLTGRETLAMYARLRGIAEENIAEQISELSKMLSFDMHLDKRVGVYSGGNLRKISTAIALLGNPRITFLDEPTTGLDPVSRRCLLLALKRKLATGMAIVLTSHSMEECELLCTRLIIMVNGQICCIGSPRELKNKFGNGYHVQLKISRSGDYSANVNATQKFINDTFPHNKLKEVHQNVLHYAIEGEKVRCSQIFGHIERAKEKLNIDDYSVCQTNLEQIFLSFARHQVDEEQ